MLPIASFFFCLNPCLFLVLLEDLKAVVEVHTYLTQDRQVEIPTWNDLQLDKFQTSPWSFYLPETQLHRQQTKPHRMKSKNADTLKIISHLMRKYDSNGMLK